MGLCTPHLVTNPMLGLQHYVIRLWGYKTIFKANASRMGRFKIKPNFYNSRSFHCRLFVPTNYVDLEWFCDNLLHCLNVVGKWVNRNMIWICLSHLEFKGIEFILWFCYFFIFMQLMILKHMMFSSLVTHSQVPGWTHLRVQLCWVAKSWDLKGAPDFQHWRGVEGRARSLGIRLGRWTRRSSLNLHPNTNHKGLVSIREHPWVLGQATGNLGYLIHHSPDLGEATTFPHIVYSATLRRGYI